MDPGGLPIELQGRTEVEEMLITRTCPITRVYRLPKGQRGYGIFIHIYDMKTRDVN